MSSIPDASLPTPAAEPARRHPAWRGFATNLLIFLLGSLVFYLLKPLALEGGDTALYTEAQWVSIFWREGFVYYNREPLAHQLVRLVYLAVGDLHQAFILCSAVSGGLFLVLLRAFSRTRVVWAAVLVSCLTWNFVGHIELYGATAVVLLLYFIVLVRALEPTPRATPVQAALALALAFMTHKLAFFFAPALLCLAFRRIDGRWRVRPWPARQWEKVLLIIIGMCALDLLPAIANLLDIRGLLYITFTEGLLDMLTPPSRGWAFWVESRNDTGMYFLFTLGSPLHLAHFFGFVVAGAPVGLVLLALNWRRIRSATAAPLVVASVIGIVWIFVWHPRIGWKDWDLFSMGTLPLNLLAGGAAAGMFERRVGSAAEEGAEGT
ncbi:MAG TPA: hypothetical protein PLS90_14030 [Candidatus Sumerlaeota bacterium]|nr:hypothetical protein [Candidatus Sumerlaeota bacterium]HOR27223.1 hypothetical protein [Candidatus Sumerlaeota bacterium]HPK03563.1 hypothetical protein [Candidatus Sumerlaeota bacterium]